MTKFNNQIKHNKLDDNYILNDKNEVYELEDEELDEEYEKYKQNNINSAIKEESIETEDEQSNGPIYVMTLEIEEGKATDIEIFNNTNPEKLSNQLCLQYGLDDQAAKYLQEEITNLILNHKNKNENESAENEENNAKIDFFDLDQNFNEVESNEGNEGFIKEEENLNVSTKRDNNAETYFNIKSTGNNNLLENFKQIRKEDTQDEIEVIQDLDDLEDNTADYNKEVDKPLSIIKKFQESLKNDNNMNNDQQSSKVDNILLELPSASASSLEKMDSRISIDKQFQSEIKQKEVKENKDKDNNQSYNQKLNVFDKLYQDAYKRRNNNNCRNMSNEKTISVDKLFHSNSSYCNKGEVLYYEGVKNIEKKYKQIAELKQAEELRLNKYCTFKPKITRINPSSSNIVTCNTKVLQSSNNMSKQQIENKTNKDYQLFHNTSIEKGVNDTKNTLNLSSQMYNYSNYIKSKEELIEKLKEKHYPKEEEENNHYTFQPFISNTSNQIVANMNPDNYMDRKIKKQEKLITDCIKEYTFSPKIINDYFNNVHVNENSLGKLSFKERQKIYEEISNNKKKELGEMYNKTKDNKTGQQLFNPVLIANHHHNRESRNVFKNNNINVYDSNYQYANKYSLKKKARENEYLNYIKSSSKPKVLNNTENIYEKMKIKAFSNLFNMLDTDLDDRISTVSINLKTIDNKSKSIIAPILKELHEENESLNKIEFNLAMNHLFKVI